MLTKRQREVAAALYQGKHSEAELCRKYGLQPKVLQTWLARPDFQQELHRLCEAAQRTTRFTINRAGPAAAMKLTELLDSEKEDTARRAALDMIDRCLQGDDAPARADADEADISDEEVRRTLLVLARGQRTHTEGEQGR